MIEDLWHRQVAFIREITQQVNYLHDQNTRNVKRQTSIQIMSVLNGGSDSMNVFSSHVVCGMISYIMNPKNRYTLY